MEAIFRILVCLTIAIGFLAAFILWEFLKKDPPLEGKVPPDGEVDHGDSEETDF
jgi:hypothetical protein